MSKKRKYPRSSGVLLPITALHGPFGIGVLGAEAMEFIDFLSGAGFHIWQILPAEHTSACFSPYKCVSAFAGEPMLIDPRMLLEMRLITKRELTDRANEPETGQIDYEIIREKQWIILRLAFSRLIGKPYADFKPSWLDSYALFMALKRRYGDDPWYEWPDKGERSHGVKSLRAAKEELAEEIEFNKFVQWLFDIQWRKIKDYAAKRGVSIFGDLPIYVSEDSVEVWNRRRLFDADADGNFRATGGAPPDYFTPDGQHWGNPIYNWPLMEKDNFKWWAARIKAAVERYDIIRLDHFRGFEGYWSIPAGAETAREGKWEKGPGLPLFKAIEEKLGKLPVIAEDLGEIDEDVEALLKETGFRGMRVLQFGFSEDDLHMPHSYTEDCIAYTGTHDNTTLFAWIFDMDPEDRERVLFYTGFGGDWTSGGPNCEINKSLIRSVFTSAASIAIVPIQDMLGYGMDTRTNTPGTPEGNWRFRIRDGALGLIDSGFYAELNKACYRDNPAAEVDDPETDDDAEADDDPATDSGPVTDSKTN